MRLSRGSAIFLVVCAVVVAGVFYGLDRVTQQLDAPPDVDRQPVEFVVAEGATVASLSEDLEEAGIIRNALFFRLSARNDIGSNLQAGTYDLETGLTVDEAIAMILEGPRRREVFSIRVIEGLTIEETLASLAEQTPFSVEEYRAVLDERLAAGEDVEGGLRIPPWWPDPASFGPGVREPYEGMLFPDTYELFVDVSARDVLQRMVDELEQVFINLPNAEVREYEEAGGNSYEALVIASLVERETQVDEERPTVSGVIANRLEIGQRLDIDASVIYALDRDVQRVLFEDLEVDSPYNTYRNAGLPPTPISGSGRAAIRAAIAPAEHEFLYYVLTPECDGRHAFAATLGEHNVNVAAFREADNCGVGTG